MARLLDISVPPTVSAATLISHVRELIFALQNEAKARRYAYLPTDVVWWARTLNASKGQIYYNVRDAVMSGEQIAALEAAMASYANWDEMNAATKALDYAQRVKARLYQLYVRLCVMFLVRQGYTGRMYYERNNLLGLLCTRYTPFVDYERIEVNTGQRKAVILTVLSHYLLLSTATATNEGWVRGLKNVEQYFAQAALWAASGDVLRGLAGSMNDATRSSVYTLMGPQRLESALRGAYPRGKDMIADVLAYMLAETNFMQRLFGERRYKLATLFRGQMRALADDPPRLVEFFQNVSNVHALVATWSDRQAVDREHVFDYAVRALAMLREITEQQGTIYTCYMHLVERRQLQFAAPAQPAAFVFPPPVEIPRIEQTTPVSFLRDKTCLLSNAVVARLPFTFNPDDVLGAGANGVVFGTTDAERVVKITDFFTENEYAVQCAAGELGFGPRTYSRHHLSNVVVVVKGSGLFNNISLIVSERLAETLDVVLGRQTKLDACMRVVDAVLTVVRRFNAANFVHHDLKPNNIMLTRADADPTDPISWRLIDYGLAWYGGAGYDPLSVVKTETSEPYGWNPRTSTLEDPREAYGGWIRATPPSLIPSWDQFCLLFHLFVYVPSKKTFRLSKDFFREELAQRMQQLIADHPEHYASMTGDATRTFMHSRVKRDFCDYTRVFALDDTRRDQPWSVRCNYRELQHAEGDAVWRLFVPRSFLKQYGITIVDRVAANAYTCCNLSTCNATIRFLDEGEEARRDEYTLRKMSRFGGGPQVVLSEMQMMPRILERERKTTTAANVRALVLDRAGRPFSEVLKNSVDSVVTPDLAARLKELLTAAFRFARGLAAGNYVHHRLNANTLFYDEETKAFFLIDCSEVWYGGLKGRRAYGGFTFGDGLRMQTPQYSLGPALLFVDVYNNFILNRVGGADRRIESELATYMRRVIYHNHFFDYKECERLVLHSSGRVTIQYAYTDANGERRQVDL